MEEHMKDEQAAIAGTYHNLRPVVGRKVFQVHIELPIEHMSAFVKAFGEPNPDTWIGLARMNLKGGTGEQPRQSSSPDKPKEADGANSKKSWDEILPSQQAGILCGDPKFWTFLLERGVNVYDTIGAATWVRQYCNVNTRADITPRSPAALAKWRELVVDYRLWSQAVI